jgi:hypothetical protein
VVGHLIQHFTVGMCEPHVVLEEIGMAKHMGNHQFLVNPLVTHQQVGIAWIGVDHHLINAMQPIRIGLCHPFVFHAKSPVRITVGKPIISRHLVHHAIIQHLVLHREKVQAELARVPFQLFLQVKQILW